jgi:hypothetical protein
VGVNKQQLTVLAIVAGLAVFIGAGIALLASSGGNNDQSIRTGGSTSSSSSPDTTTSTFAVSTSSAPPVTIGPLATLPAITPGSTQVVVPRTTTTRPPVTTTRPPATTTRPSVTTTTAAPSGDVGISNTEIRVAVITDETGTYNGMRAWARSVNHRGGVAGRKIRLDPFNPHGTTAGYLDAVRTACSRDFSIVGSLSFADAPTASADCAAIPDVPVEAVADEHAIAANTYPAFPHRSTAPEIGPYRWLADHVSGCCSQFVLVPDTEPARTRTLAALDAATGAGFTRAGTADIAAGDPSSRYDEIVGTIADTHATFASSGLGLDSTVLLRQSEQSHATDVKAWYCDASCYDTAFIAKGADAVDQEYISIETTPLGDHTPALRRYARSAVRSGDVATYAGLRGYVAGTLFENAAAHVVADHGHDGLTRARLLDALAGTHAFTAGGIVGPTDIGQRAPNGCLVMLKVRNGGFKRVDPTAKGSLDCAPGNIVVVGP